VRGQGGFALVVTLLVTALLVALTVEFITEVYVDTTARRNYVNGQQASLLAESGIEGAKKILQVTLAAQTDYTTLADQWARPMDFPDESGNLRVTMEEENAKLNLNYLGGVKFNPAYIEAARRLFRSFVLPADDLVDSLTDWIDSDEIPKPGGGETAYYQSRKPAYRQSNAPLLTLEELSLVKGFDSRTYRRVSPFVTVYDDPSDGAWVNINTAPKEVLMSLDGQISDSLAESIIDYRKTTPFKSRGDLSKVPGMSSSVISAIGVKIDTKGKLYRIRSEATVGETTRVIEAVVNLSVVASPQILYWREY
jgi:general secretion pathway protein K